MSIKNVNLSKLAPWNWFMKEEQPGSSVPVRVAGQNDSTLANPILALHQQVDQLFNDFFQGFGLSPLPRFSMPQLLTEGSRWLKPNLDILASDKEYTLQVELPGVSDKDVRIEVSGDSLRIWGEKKQEKEDKGRDYYAVERSYGSFQRVLALPQDAKVDGIDAKFKDGVLTITIPRDESASQTVRKIEVKSE
jgi:HSP20 family protein